MKKIVVIGSGGSGKSTLARQLGEITKLPVYHLDALFWKPGWTPMARDEWEQLQRELVRKSEWIIDGNYGSTLDIRMEAADTIIFFDLSRWVTTYRVLKRRVMYHGKTRPDLTEGCPEQLDFEFIKWVWNFSREKRPAILEKLEKYSGSKRVLILRKKSDAELLLQQFAKKAQL